MNKIIYFSLVLILVIMLLSKKKKIKKNIEKMTDTRSAFQKQMDIFG